MKDKKETPVSWLVDKLFSDNEIFGVPEKLLSKALEMESKKQQKYDEMLAMLDECLNIVGDVPLGVEMTEWHKKAQQLIKEAKKL
jgi:biotin synthase-related radical SAM superfamily protein